jgi:hypothetical protein
MKIEFKNLCFKEEELVDSTGTHIAKQALIKLDNGLEVSVVNNKFSLGGQKGLYEMGALNPSGGMVYIEEWQDEVKGWLTQDGVEKELEHLQQLKI